MSRSSAASAATAARSMSFWFVLLAALFLAGPLPSAHGDITPTGDVSPDPSTWDSSTTGYIGNTASGTLTVDGGSSLLSSYGYIGYGSGSSGAVNVVGTGSTWTSVYLGLGGLGGDGTLSITKGGSVSSAVGWIGDDSGSTGAVTVDGAGSVWTNSQFVSIGNYGSGTLSITNAGTVSSSASYIGNSPGSTGVVTVDGTGSTWTTTTFSLFVGNSGSGTLSITDGGSVSVAGATLVGANSGSTGRIDFGTNGGTLTTGSLFASPSQLTGIGTVNTRGLVSDLDLRFDSTHGLKQTFAFQQSGQNVLVNLDMTNLNGTTLGVGLKDAGSLVIRDGIKVNSSGGYLGYGSGSTGVATVTGSGSKWTCGTLVVGYSGSGTLLITNGGTVWGTAYIGVNSGSGAVTVDGMGSTWSSSSFSVGSSGSSGNGTLSITNGGRVSIGGSSASGSIGSTGAVTVDGTGSTWTNGGGLSVRGALSITGGGTVTAASVSLGSGSLLAIDVGRGSLLTVGGGTGTFTFDWPPGAIRTLAGADVAANTRYLPISSAAIGSYPPMQAVGGTWDARHDAFTVSSVTSGISGSAVALDLSSVQRALVSDNGIGGTGWTVGASFVAGSSTTNITFSATAISGTTFDALKSLLPSNESVLSGWEFSTTGYTVSSTNPVYLSFNVGAGHPAADLDLWHYDGSSWTKYTPTDLTYDGTYASFTATGFSGYAMSAVPEPGSLALLAAGLFGVLGYARRKWKQR